MNYKATSFEGVFYKVEQCPDGYIPAGNELLLTSQAEAEAFPIPCRWDEETQAWVFAPVPEGAYPPVELEPEEPEPPSELERLRADVDFIAAIQGVEL